MDPFLLCKESSLASDSTSTRDVSKRLRGHAGSADESDTMINKKLKVGRVKKMQGKSGEFLNLFVELVSRNVDPYQFTSTRRFHSSKMTIGGRYPFGSAVHGFTFKNIIILIKMRAG